MEDIQTFLETNYLWIAIIAIVLLVTVIGYIADKKGLGKPKTKKEKNKKEIEVKQDVVKIPDVNETINNLNETSDIINDNYVDAVANNEVNDAFNNADNKDEIIDNNMEQKENNLISNEKIDFNNNEINEKSSLPIEKTLKDDNGINESSIDNKSYIKSPDLQPSNDSLDDSLDTNSDNSIEQNNVNNSNEENKMNMEELNFDEDFSNLENENKKSDNVDSNEKNEVNSSTDDFDDLFKEESVPEKIEVPDVEPTQTLNIDNDFNKLLDDVDDNEETINYELPKINSIDSSDLSDDDIWKF